MKLLDFINKAGWPISTDTFEWMQNQMLQLQYGSLLGGSNYILQGCTVNNGITTNGWVVVNGEVLPFVGGALQANVIVVDVPTQREFFGGQQNNYYHERTATFGTATVQYAWSTFSRNDPANGVLSRLDKVEKMLKPLLGYSVNGTTVYGSWLFWGRPASEIPAGWEAVPDADWKGRGPVVLDETQTEFNTVGKTGGSKTVTLTDAQLTHEHDIPRGDSYNGDDEQSAMRVGGGQGSNTQTPIPLKIGNSDGSRAPLNILQPYKVVMFIRFVG